MAFCGNCGATLSEGVAFCGSCGKPVGTANWAAASVPQGSSVGGTSAGAMGSAALSTNLAAALAYALGLVSGVIFLVLEPYKNDRFVRFHAMQSIFFSATCIVFAIAWSIVWGILISVGGGFLVFVAIPLRLLISFGIFVFWLFVMYQAYNRREYRIPFIGQIAAKQAG